MTIEYDTPFEVTEKQYRKVMAQYAGCVAGKFKEGKYYIKVWAMQHAPGISKLIEL